MTEEKKPKNENQNQNQQIRYDLVNTAVSFLLNPSVINKPYEQKTAFLRKKGLTEAEISLTYEKAENDPKYKQIQHSSNVSEAQLILPPPVPVYRPVSFWSQLSRFSSSLIVLGVAAFGVHYVYKNYIKHLIFGEDKQGKSDKLEQQLLEMANSLLQLEKHVSSLEESINYQKEQMDKLIQNEVNEYYPTPLALRELKTEISSVKSLLLNRHQFPAVPRVTPTIPHWQLPSTEMGDDASKQNGEIKEQHDLGENTESDINQGYEFELGNNDTAIQSNGSNDIIITEVKSIQQEYSEERND